MLDDLYHDTEKKMTKARDGLDVEIRKIRTGRAHPNLLDHVMVESYGSKMPLPQVASINVEGARSLLVSPWDKNQVAACEKAIRTSDLGLNPSTQGSAIRVPLPILTEERRKEMVKMAKEVAESGKIAVRNVRRSTLQEVKSLLKEKAISEDDEKIAEDRVNVLTEKYVSSIQSILDAKIKDLQEVK